MCACVCYVPGLIPQPHVPLQDPLKVPISQGKLDYHSGGVFGPFTQMGNLDSKGETLSQGRVRG